LYHRNIFNNIASRFSLQEKCKEQHPLESLYQRPIMKKYFGKTSFVREKKPLEYYFNQIWLDFLLFYCIFFADIDRFKRWM